MALGKDFDRDMTYDLGWFFLHEAERGGVASVYTGASGAALDNGSAVASYRSTSSGAKPLGILAMDVVNKDLTRDRVNEYKLEAQQGTKVSLYTTGWCVTNMIKSGVTVAAGDWAYLDTDGRVTNVNTGAVASPFVGMFKSAKNEKGFARLDFNFRK